MASRCRWCNADFESRNQLFVHVRCTPACAAAAAAEDDRATAVLFDNVAKTKAHSVILFVRHVSSIDELEQDIAKQLQTAGATKVFVHGSQCLVSSDDGNEHNLSCSLLAVTCVCKISVEDVFRQVRVGQREGQDCVASWQLFDLTRIGIGEGSGIASKFGSMKLPVRSLRCEPQVCPRSDGDVSSNITVIVTTSPMRSDPELDVLETTFASLKLVGLDRCRAILVCDHLDAVEVDVAQDKLHLKAGRLPRAHIHRYRERLAKLREAHWAAAVEILELESWHGFTLAIQQAIHLVETPLVCVIQHDLAFLHQVDLSPLVEVLLREHGGAERVNFVNFPRWMQRDYREQLRRRTGLEVGAPVAFDTSKGSVSLTRLPQFLDGTHIARADWYRHLFETASRDEPLRPMLRRGAFIELVLGKYMLKLAKHAPEKSCIGGDVEDSISKGVMDVCTQFGGWLWHLEDPQDYLIFHLHSARHYAQWERKKKDLPESHYIREYFESLVAADRQLFGFCSMTDPSGTT